MIDAVIGIDVGTGSARAGVFSLTGARLGVAAEAIGIWRPQADFVQQSSADIWRAVVAAARAALRQAGDVRIGGIGFDATCSLLMLDAQCRPLSVDPDGAAEQDIIVWMDHRAQAQAAAITATGHPSLRAVGGRLSPEMDLAKLAWLQRHLPAAWARATHLVSLPDYLAGRATGAAVRSNSAVLCKWLLGGPALWDPALFRLAGLDDVPARLGADIAPLGTPMGRGLLADVAAALGLPAGTPVSTAAVDSHAGAIGLFGLRPAPGSLAMICGTSTCHLALAPAPHVVPGIWGPYADALLPGSWLTEAGQSATGALIDHVVFGHAAYADVAARLPAGRSIYEHLNQRLDGLPATLTETLHMLPYFHGNRSPRADPSLLGGISGLSLSAGADDFALLYLATIQAIAYGTRHIIAAMAGAGLRVDTILATGGAAKNALYLREHADATGCPIMLPREEESVLLGAAILGAAAGGAFPDLRHAMAAMTAAGAVIEPAQGATAAYHQRKYDVFQRMYVDQMAYRDVMSARAVD